MVNSVVTFQGTVFCSLMIQREKKLNELCLRGTGFSK